jgi:2-methylcitrate dehydratase PrpD
MPPGREGPAEPLAMRSQAFGPHGKFYMIWLWMGFHHDHREGAMTAANDNSTGLTKRLSALSAASQFGDWSGNAVTVAKQCTMDLLGVTLAGMNEPLSAILLEEVAEDGGNEQATVIGREKRANCQQAALVNGAAGHALDYDDVHWAMFGHPTVPVLPAALALAEHGRASGKDLLNAFINGYETECRVGAAVGGHHYEKGWHGTGTIGTFGATAASARLLGLDDEETAQAFGIAGTQAAGLKSMFGTMCKPFHAGHAAATGLTSARLAKRGFSSRPDVLETAQGFADARGDRIDPDRAFVTPESGAYVRGNLFKYHAACYLTHSSIEALRGLKREHQQIVPENIGSVSLIVDPGHLNVCNIQSPTTGLEAKFSLRLTAAMALADVETADIGVYTDALTRRTDLAALRDRVSIETARLGSTMESKVSINLNDGSTITGDYDAGVPAADLDEQWNALESKFHALVDPLLGDNRAGQLVEACRNLDAMGDISELTRMTV